METAQQVRKTKSRQWLGRKQCPGCLTFKKADNCIRCFRLERARRTELERRVEDLKVIVAVTPYYRLGPEVQAWIATIPMGPPEGTGSPPAV